MNRKDLGADRELIDALTAAVNDLERMKAAMQGVIVAVDDVCVRMIARHDKAAPGPWDDEHPDNRPSDCAD